MSLSGDELYVVVDNTAHRISVFGPYTSFEDAETVLECLRRQNEDASLCIKILEWLDPTVPVPSPAVYCGCDALTQKVAGHWERAGRWVCNECGNEKPF